MGHASGFTNLAIGEELIVAWKCIRLENTTKASQVRLRVLTLPIRRISKPDGRWCC